jgi:hypothetical protein
MLRPHHVGYQQVGLTAQYLRRGQHPAHRDSLTADRPFYLEVYHQYQQHRA